MEQHLEYEHNEKLHEVCTPCGNKSLTWKQRKQSKVSLPEKTLLKARY